VPRDLPDRGAHRDAGRERRRPRGFHEHARTGTLFGLYDLFSGGGLRRATVFALGIMPYISASIVFQLAGPVFPIIEKMQRDEEGKKTLTQWTRYVTVVLCLFQAMGSPSSPSSSPAQSPTPGGHSG